MRHAHRRSQRVVLDPARSAGNAAKRQRIGVSFAVILGAMRRLVLALFLTSSVACHPGQPLAGGVAQPASGTVSGAVTASDKSVPLTGRKVTLTETSTNAHYDTTTAANGGYTIQVPPGTYRIEVELRPPAKRSRSIPPTRM